MARFQTERVNTMPKTVNYTSDQVSKMVNDYQLADTTQTRKDAIFNIAADLGKSTKSVIAKLSREGVYIKAEKVTKTGAKVVKKETLVKKIADLLGADFSEIKSLGKATKADLELVLSALEDADFNPD